MLRKLMLAVFVLSSLLVALPVAAQDGESQTYVTQEGLVFDYPADWFATDFTGFVFISNNETAFNGFEPTEPGSFVFTGIVGSASDLASTLEQEFATVDELGDLLVDSLETNSGTVLSNETVELGGKSVIVILGESSGETNLVYVFEVDGLFVFGIVSAASDDVFESARPDLDALVASMRVDLTAEPTGGELDFGTGEVEVTAFPQLGVDAFVFYNPISVDNAKGIAAGSIDQAVQLADGSVLVSAGTTFYDLDLATGALSNPVIDSQYLFLSNLVAAPDGTMWGQSYSMGLVNIDRNFNVITSTGAEAFGGAFIDSVAVDSAGTVYAFASLYADDGSSTGTVYVFDGAGVLQSSFVTNGEADEFGFSPFAWSVTLFALADGNLLLVDSFLDSKIVDPAGNFVADGPQYVAEFEYVSVSDLAVGADGSLYVMTYDGTVRKYGPDGAPVAEIGQPQAEENVDAPFQVGEIPTYGKIVVLGDNQILVAGTNFTNSVVTLIDFSVAPAPAE